MPNLFSLTRQAAFCVLHCSPASQFENIWPPNSPVYIVILKGNGIFSGGENREQHFGPGTLLVFDTSEMHAVRAEGEELVFVTFLHGAPGAQ